MSAGAFSSTKYESDLGSIYAIKVQPETVSAVIDGVANAAPAGAIDQEVSAQVSKGRRAKGMNARVVRLRFTGALPDGYSGGLVTIPVLTPATFNSWTATSSKTGTYLGSPVEVAGFSPQTKR